MIIVNWTNNYGGIPYYKLYRDGEWIANSLGYENTRQLIQQNRRRYERVRFTDNIITEHQKLVESIKGDRRK